MTKNINIDLLLGVYKQYKHLNKKIMQTITCMGVYHVNIGTYSLQKDLTISDNS